MAQNIIKKIDHVVFEWPTRNMAKPFCVFSDALQMRLNKWKSISHLQRAKKTFLLSEYLMCNGHYPEMFAFFRWPRGA